jgi:selenocysteine lyase/cysteine desulfurase
MWKRRAFLQASGALGAALAARNLEAIEAATAKVADRSPDEVARDEFYWREIQQAFILDRTLINLNNGHHCPQPRVVHEAVKRYMDLEVQAPVHYGGVINRNGETVRRRLASEFGCDPGEMAVTRNASESLQIVQNGIDLAPGDEVITTEQDYPRMLTTWDQRLRRDKIKVTRLPFTVPAKQDDLYQRFERAITPRTKVLHFCHITNLTGQLFPVQRICRMARQRGITTIVDGAHAGGHFPFKLRDLDCDAYGVSLHKWLLAPLGTGLLYVRNEKIPSFWPLQAAVARQANDIRKFEEIGTAPAALRAGIAEALAFHQAVGVERKAARLFYLTTYWANRLKQQARIRMFSSLLPGETWGLALVGIEGMDASKIAAFLWDKYRVIVPAIKSGELPGPQFEYQGVRVTPNIYTTLEELDTFCEGMEDLLKNGLPA